MDKLPRLWLVLAGLLLTAATCQSERVNDPTTVRNAGVHYDLGVENQAHGDVRGALREYEEALRIDPDYYQAEGALGILMHLSFRQPDVAEQHYKKALLLKPGYSEAKVNLGNLYMDETRYDDAIALYEEALKDILYQKPWLAENNEGWAYYKKGEVDKAIMLIQEAVRVNPEFCQAHRNLGLIYMEMKSDLPMAHQEFEKLVKKCPDNPDSYFELAQELLKEKDQAGGCRNFALCRDHAKEGDPLLDDCTKLASGCP
jgi:Tfp pilus assembly protein PilF